MDIAVNGSMDQSEVIESILTRTRHAEIENMKHADLIFSQVGIAEAGGIMDVDSSFDRNIIRCSEAGCFCILDDEYNVIVPLRKYEFIGMLDNAYARVYNYDRESGRKKWGIIDMNGREVVPLDYDYVWKPSSRNPEYVDIKKNGIRYWFDLIEGEIC